MPEPAGWQQLPSTFLIQNVKLRVKRKARDALSNIYIYIFGSTSLVQGTLENTWISVCKKLRKRETNAFFNRFLTLVSSFSQIHRELISL